MQLRDHLEVRTNDKNYASLDTIIDRLANNSLTELYIDLDYEEHQTDYVRLANAIAANTSLIEFRIMDISDNENAAETILLMR